LWNSAPCVDHQTAIIIIILLGCFKVNFLVIPTHPNSAPICPKEGILDKLGQIGAELGQSWDDQKVNFETPCIVICHYLLDELILLIGSHMTDVIMVRAVPTDVDQV
jgi:hypothetical protein